MQQDGRKTIYIAQSIKECLSEEFEQDNETVIICIFNYVCIYACTC